jgi:hypothetical protein
MMSNNDMPPWRRCSSGLPPKADLAFKPNAAKHYPMSSRLRLLGREDIRNGEAVDHSAMCIAVLGRVAIVGRDKGPKKSGQKPEKYERSLEPDPTMQRRGKTS